MERKPAGSLRQEHFYQGQCGPGIHFEEPFRLEANPEKPISIPAFVDIIPGVNRALVGGVQPEEDGSDRYGYAFLKQKEACRIISKDNGL